MTNERQALPPRELFSNVVLAIHGGAGPIREDLISLADEKTYRANLEAALQAGFQALQSGGSSMDATIESVKYLEDCPLFNAGHGAVFTHDGKIELDASIMDGATHRAGAVAGLTCVRNPITAARAVMENTPHVMLMGEGAEQFAKQQGLVIVDPSYFYTERQWQRLQNILKGGEGKGGTAACVVATGKCETALIENKYGTVGSVARDRKGNLAAATSTGGTIDKQFGRVGDSPIIGAGTYADNATAAISCTGHGEFFMRHVAAYDVCALMKYKGETLAGAANTVIDELAKLGGSGGLIAIDAQGNCALPFNSEGMFRGCITADGQMFVALFDK